MKKHQPKNTEEIKTLLTYLNSCHDGSIKKISFIKDRDINQDGDLSYPFEDAIGGNIEIELILNNYEGAKKYQIVVLQFQNVRIFNFYQNTNFDYSDVYELKFNSDKGFLSFNFYSTAKKIKSLIIICKQMVCIEK